MCRQDLCCFPPALDISNLEGHPSDELVWMSAKVPSVLQGQSIIDEDDAKILWLIILHIWLTGGSECSGH